MKFHPGLGRIFHELLAATTDMAVLPGVLGCRPLRRTVQVRKPIPRYRGTVVRCHAHLRDLATAIHEISGLEIANKVVTGGRGRGKNTII